MKPFFKTTALTVILSSAAITTSAFAETSIATEQEKVVVLKKIVITGNGRLSDVAVIALMSFREGDEFKKSDESSIVKELYETQKFSSVKASLNGDVLKITVIENAIVNNFIFNGNKVVKEKELLQAVGVKVRSVSTRATKGTVISNIRAFYKIRGFYHVKIKAEEKKLSSNRVDYVFTIDEGDISTIKKIDFVGNSAYSDSNLRDVILSKEDAWYRFLSDNDVYNKGRLQADKQFLLNFYKNRGFVDFKIKDVKATLSKNKKDFFLKFFVEEGKRYKLGKLEIVGGKKGIDKTRLNAFLSGGEKYGYYYAKGLQKAIVNVTRELSKQGFPFTEIVPKLKRTIDKNGQAVIDVLFDLQEGRRIFVERIIVRGNTRTLDKVIRRELELVEGDPFNPALMRKSESNVRELGYFSNTKVNFSRGSSENKVIVYVDVEEQTTGSLSFGAGYSNTNGIGFKISASEDNFLGRGQKTKVELKRSGKDVSFDLAFTEPRFMGRDVAASAFAKHVLYDKVKASGYKAREIALGGSLSHNLNEKWAQSISSKVRSYNLFDVRTTAISSVKAEAGKATGVDLTYGLAYTDLDDILNPKKGQKITVNVGVNSIGSRFKNNTVSVKGIYLYPINEDMVFSAVGMASTIIGYKKLRLSDRLYLNTDHIRGFDKIGAQDSKTGTLLGGTTRLSLSTEVDFPVGLPKSLGVKGSVFVGAAKLSGTPPVASGVTLVGQDKLRSSAGFGFKWESPIGSMRFDFVKVLKKADSDSTRTFQFTVGFGL